MKTVFMFSGQGSQYCGMGRELYDNYQVCRDIFDRADEVLGFKISDICFNENELLNKTEYTQPAVFIMSLACLQLVLNEGLKPDYVCGLSLGEYAALYSAGVFSFEDCLKLVHKRGRFMTEAYPAGAGAMSAIMGMSREQVLKLCSNTSGYGLVAPANYNMPGQIVISGDTEAVEKAGEAALSEGAKKVIKLNVSGPFHTELMKPAAERLRAELDGIRVGEMNVPVITNLTGGQIESNEEIIPTLVKHMTSTVMWEDGINNLISQGAELFIELGSGKTLCSFVRKINRDAVTYNVEDIKTFEKTISNIRGLV